MKEQLKILVAYHKPDKIVQDEVYTPIYVGSRSSIIYEQFLNK